MKIGICIKQVPSSDKLLMDDEKGTLIRSAKENQLNPSDEQALEAALSLTDDGQKIAITMGPQSAETILRHSFAMGIDEGVLLSGREFAGADVYVTAFTLGQAIKKLGGFDLILCGQHTSDGDTGMVGMALAAQLNWPYLANVVGIDGVKEKKLSLRQEIGQSRLKVRVDMPCVLTIKEGIFRPRLPSLKRKLATKNKAVIRLKLEDLEIKEASRYGLQGSPTRVVKMFSPFLEKKERIIQGTDQDLAQLIAKTVKERLL